MFPSPSAVNRVITFLSIVSTWPLASLATDRLFDYCLLKQGNGATQSLPRWFYRGGRQIDNITDWGLEEFQKHFGFGRRKTGTAPITKEAIFHYVYGVLHDPIYREKYALNLKREFPRIPFYADFWTWAGWGKELMDLHIGYEKVAPAKLKRTDRADEKASGAGTSPRVLLKTDKVGGRILIDSETTLASIPSGAWEYKLGNRSAIDWILDQYKEKKPKDPTIRERFNTYRFADHKEKVIDLLARVTTVSVKTVEIVEAMRRAHR
jgi:predicted helicase